MLRSFKERGASMLSIEQRNELDERGAMKQQDKERRLRVLASEQAARMPRVRCTMRRARGGREGSRSRMQKLIAHALGLGQGSSICGQSAAVSAD